MKSFHLLTPFLFSLAFLLNTYFWTASIASPDQLVRAVLVLWSLLALLFYPAYRLTRRSDLASLLLTVFVFGVYFSETFFKVIGSILLAAALLWWVYSRIRRFRASLAQLVVLLNGIGLAILLYSVYLNAQSFSRVPWPVYRRAVDQAQQYSIEGLSPPPVKPDIYYIVLDGYPRSDILEKYYGYDNSPLTRFLEERGFHVPEGIHSNYGMTAVSISSTLNMDYVSSYAPGIENSHFWWLMTPFIGHSRVRAVLEAQRYRSTAFSTWTLTGGQSAAPGGPPYPLMLNDFERYLLGDTPLGLFRPVLRPVASVPTYETHRRMILHFFDSLEQSAGLPGPKFVFAHVTAPHPPFVFDGQGNPLNPPVAFTMHDAGDFYGSDQEYREGYVGQVEFLNAKLKVVVDAILEQSDTPPIIIIQADHGSALLADFTSAENTCIEERFSPFAAYYLPGMDPALIPDDLTSVNLFRVLFNHYFEAELPLLENKHYYYKGRLLLFNMVDVTARVDQECTA